ncbi:CHAT domain-containing protein [Maribacter dokdonensis]|uniref:CHAT domain-containing protein n=1 Tax=Maribacter dokdonensis TaxID=320912 RepID=UPI00071995B6|nr:CHAT domain-containing protein [Maribacter dokdonensis]KSA14193.1 Tetratricopeptide repeat family protein [Maribacter dokdonensis DSW-8]
MKLKLILTVTAFFCIVKLGYAQDWHKYSDSIISNFRINNYSRAKEFLSLAETDIKITGHNTDTIYADFLYRKGLIQYLHNESPIKSFDESLSIWKSSNNINYLKLIRIYYFYGEHLRLNEKYLESYKYYKTCYEIGKSHNLEFTGNFEGSLYNLCLIDYWENENYENAEKWALEYIELKKSTAFNEFNFSYVSAHQYANMPEKEIDILEKYLDLYIKNKIDSPSTLSLIHIKLMNSYYLYNDNYLEAIKYGEKALEIINANELADDNLNLIYGILSSSYHQIGDNINEHKYEELEKLNLSKNSPIDYYDELKNLVIAEEFSQFETKFTEYTAILKLQQNYNELLTIYSIALTLFEKSIIFDESEITILIKELNENQNSLDNEHRVYLKMLSAEFSFFIKDFLKALKICNENLYSEDIDMKLMFYRIKSLSEAFLGLPTSRQSIYETISIAEKAFGEYNPQTLEYVILPLLTNTLNNDNQTVEIAVKALEIIYNNNLEHTMVAAQFWQGMANEAGLKNNLLDAIKYSQQSITICEKLGKAANPMNYYASLLTNSNAHLLSGNIEEAKESLDKAKLYIDGQSNMMDVAYADYHHYLGDFYFWQDKFLKAKENYITSQRIYGPTLSKGRDLNLILCDYFINMNVEITINRLEEYYEKNGDITKISKLIYLLKFNTGNTEEAKRLLFKSLDKIINDNNDYFHLLSDIERENLYSKFTDEFEFLNSHLLLNKTEEFLIKYINHRLYLKNLLFDNSSKNLIQNEQSVEYLNLLKKNNTLINKYYENQKNGNFLSEINQLEQKNREIEKFLSKSDHTNERIFIDEIKDNLTLTNAYVEIIRINKQSKSATKDKLNIINQFTDSINYGAIIIKKNKAPKFVLISDSNDLEKNYLKDLNTYLNGNNKYKIDTDNYSKFFKPIDDELSDVESIYLVTDGIYNSINPESLFNTEKDEYVIDYLKINRIISARSLIEKKSINKIDVLTAVLIGNPEFELEKKDFSTYQTLISNTEVNLLRESSGEENIGYLPGTEKEISTIQQILKKSNYNVNTFSSKNATEENLKNINSPKILHLATHGYFLNSKKETNLKDSFMGIKTSYIESNVYLKSGLLFTGAQNTLDGEKFNLDSENGIFTAEEAKNLNLRNTELVVLSACETGLGDNQIGEGVYGLQRAFMIAGAKGVIMSLWKVDDTTTQKLMELFYINWIEKGMTKYEAFKTSKIELKKDYPEPFYWAPFILIE